MLKNISKLLVLLTTIQFVNAGDKGLNIITNNINNIHSKNECSTVFTESNNNNYFNDILHNIFDNSSNPTNILINKRNNLLGKKRALKEENSWLNSDIKYFNKFEAIKILIQAKKGKNGMGEFRRSFGHTKNKNIICFLNGISSDEWNEYNEEYKTKLLQETKEILRQYNTVDEFKGAVNDIVIQQNIKCVKKILQNSKEIKLIEPEIKTLEEPIQNYRNNIKTKLDLINPPIGYEKTNELKKFLNNNKNSIADEVIKEYVTKKIEELDDKIEIQDLLKKYKKTQNDI